MKILTLEQLRAAEQAALAAEQISNLDLMQRAAQTFADWLAGQFPIGEYQWLSFLCGSGNNGGDGLAAARILSEVGYGVEVFIYRLNRETEDFLDQYEALKAKGEVEITEILSLADLPLFDEREIIVDALLGSGLNRPLEGELAEIIDAINQCPNIILALDCPTGLQAEQPTLSSSIRADYTLSFETPRFAFMFPDNYDRVGEFHFRSIGLPKEFIANLPAHNYYVTPKTIANIYQKRGKYAHKGLFGHALLIMGSHGKMGAAILATRACLRAGAGLVTVHVPSCGYEVIQGAVPEAMVNLDDDRYVFTRIYDLQKYNTIAIGCGLSTKNKTRNALCYLLKQRDTPTVLDADALNILAQSPDWWEYIPKQSILTPHPKEFERMFGRSHNNFERYELLRQKAMELDVYIILKGANSCIATPEGNCYFNSTGNPGMGTAGSGDVLTGILTGLLAQPYSPLEACILGVYVHGLAGDLAVIEKSQEGLMAGDLIDYLGKAFLALNPKRKKIQKKVENKRPIV